MKFTASPMKLFCFGDQESNETVCYRFKAKWSRGRSHGIPVSSNQSGVIGLGVNFMIVAKIICDTRSLVISFLVRDDSVG